MVIHGEKRYRGVIVGWDYKALAPQEYMDMYLDLAETKQPHYLIAVDTRDRPTPQFVYVPQEKLKLAETIPFHVIHPNLDNYFEYYDSKKVKYIARPFLQWIYPKDL